MMTDGYRLARSETNNGVVFFQAVCLRCIWMGGIHRVPPMEDGVLNHNEFDDTWLSASGEGKAHVTRLHPTSRDDDD